MIDQCDRYTELAGGGGFFGEVFIWLSRPEWAIWYEQHYGWPEPFVSCVFLGVGDFRCDF
ncbi:hypothetical protein [Mycobacteroides abscessus]|uniref:hypothetical protein n=1 Tax=Mycobacteroides abscessus TaxID=36809 RepID=UPI001F32F752|nr:hypothetical protein [Mycobacteroides abscessus]